MPCSDSRDLDIRRGRVLFCFLGWGSVADTMDTLGGFAIRVEIRILDLAVVHAVERPHGSWRTWKSWDILFPGVEDLDSWGGGLWRMPWTPPGGLLDM